jgi:putative hydrolase of the HAD superfamily
VLGQISRAAVERARAMDDERSCKPRRIVLFDLGGVVCRFSPDRRLAALARASRLSVEDVHQRLFASGFDLDCDRGHYSLDQQCAHLCARLGVTGSPRELAALWAEGFAPDAEVLRLVRHVRAGAATAILTNNGPLVQLMLHARFPELAAAFDHLCFSYEVKSTKPEPRAFLGTLERLGASPGQCVFVDDAAQNVQGARAVGIDAVRFVSARMLATALHERQLM